jgi:iron complex outermembrane receptor protein
VLGPDFISIAARLPRRIKTGGLLVLTLTFPAAAQSSNNQSSNNAGDQIAALRGLSIEDLANVEVSSVSKTAQPLSDAPASIYVISHDEAMRSGATQLPDLLRQAPNLNVAQVTAGSYAISARGFNGTAADKLLVLIDGRSVYTPFNHGVLWNTQDVPPENIERIEVISGPGATLWGANAVNGVINVVTRRAGDTQGLSGELGGGNLMQRASLQYGGAVDGDVTWRLYVDGAHRQQGITAAGAPAHDGWRREQGGFRLDWSPGGDQITLQGDAYGGVEQELTTPNQDIGGRNVMARWTHPIGNGTLQAQAYYDHVDEQVAAHFSDRLNTYDLDAQYAFGWGDAQKIVVGGGWRYTDDYFPIQSSPPPFVQLFNPVGQQQSLTNGFVQDTITLMPSLALTGGLKLEDDPYVGTTPLPSARLSWKLDDTSLLWAAVSRAVRAPSRLDRDFLEYRGGALYLTGANFQSETLIAYELGYRAQPSPRSSLSLSTYYNVYGDLRSFELTKGGLPIVIANKLEGDVFGIEAWGAYQLKDWWRLSGGINWLHKDLRFAPGASKLIGTQIAGDDPRYWASLRSEMELGDGVGLDVDLRDVGSLPSPASPAYAELGVTARWAVNQMLELSLVGANLLHDQHLEFGSTQASVQLGASGVETGRSVFVNSRWRF